MAELLPDFDQLWDYQQPAETERRFRELLPAAERAGRPSTTLQLLTQIARAQGLQGKFADAHQTLDRVQPHTGDDVVVEIRYLLERGRVYNSSKSPDQARPLFLRAWEIASTAGQDFYAIDAAHMLGIVEPPDAQLAWNLKALALAEKSAEPRARKWLGSLYNNIGWTFHDQGQVEQALATFEKALAWRLEQGQEREIRIARWCVARALRSLGRLDEALTIQRELASGDHDGYVDEEIAECLLTLGQGEEARPYFAAAYDKLSSDRWLAENEPARLARLKSLAE